MPKELTIHMADTPRSSWLEVDGEMVEGIEAVTVAYQQRSPDGLVSFTVQGRVGVKNEQSKG
jgi:hypothetical protein